MATRNLVKGHTRQSKARNIGRVKAAGGSRKQAIAVALNQRDKAKKAQGVTRTTKQRKPRG